MPNIVAFPDTAAEASRPPLTCLVSAPVLLERVWPDARSRPSLRWLRQQQSAHAIPFTLVGRRVFFCPAHVLVHAGKKLTLLPLQLTPTTNGTIQLPVPDHFIDAAGLKDLLSQRLGLNRSLRWIRQQQSDRALPFVRWGRKVFFSPAQVIATLNNC